MCAFSIVNVDINQSQILKIQPTKLEIVERQDTREICNVCNSFMLPASKKTRHQQQICQELVDLWGSAGHPDTRHDH